MHASTPRRLSCLAVLAIALTACGSTAANDPSSGGSGAGSAAGSGSGAPQATGDPITLVLSGNREVFPNKDLMLPALEQTIPAEGKVSFDVKTWDELGLSGKEVLRLVESGQVDIVEAPFSQIAGDVPLLEMADLPGQAPTVELAQQVARATQPTFNEAIKDQGVIQLMTYSNPAQVLYCKDKLASLKDLQGRRVRVSGAAMGQLVEGLGAQSVSLSGLETYSALEKNAVDCAITGTGTGNALKWPEVTSYLYELPISWSIGGYYANLDWWNGLPGDTRDYLAKTFQEMEGKYWDFIAKLSIDGINCNTGVGECKTGTVPATPMTGVKPAEGDTELLTQLLKSDVLPGWLSRCGNDCAAKYNDTVAPIVGVTAG